MTTSEKVAYLKGLAEGMGVQNDAGQGKLIHVIIDVLEDLALDLADTKDALVELTDGVEEINDDLAELEEDFYNSGLAFGPDEDDWDDEDDEEEDEDDELYTPSLRLFESEDEDGESEDGDEAESEENEEDEALSYDGVLYDVTCPGCGETITFDEETLDKGSIQCPNCGETLEFDLGGDENE